MDFPALAAGLARVREVVAERQHRAGLSHDVRIVAVTKNVRAWSGPLAVTS